MLHNDQPKLIDFHCGNYNLCVTDLVRILEETPVRKGELLSKETRHACRQAFHRIHAEHRGSSESDFTQVYSLAWLRSIVGLAIEYKGEQPRRSGNGDPRSSGMDQIDTGGR